MTSWWSSSPQFTAVYSV
jgi:hypothetical protein